MPFVVDAGVVAGEGQVLDPAVAHRVEQAFGNAAQAEAAAAISMPSRSSPSSAAGNNLFTCLIR
jgi:hypothetical protein